ncbi:YggT family protein [Nocardioides mangrovicus]|uniref:YggT family protein n=1 Tax=Nocardioides mangrovicus TaxID=2478913 RepID=A0A3L8P318_9ACTN|nr:YggT family protein [Nocardioides mangrovicus]RLV48969.1 YggT family protein [Nocardioides mangrovicus]
MAVIGTVLSSVVLLFILLLFARFVMDWVQVFARDWVPHGFSLVVLEAIYSVTDPPIKAVRKVLPPIRLGAMALDLSPLIVLLIAYILLRLIGVVFG